ncbi:hypothetical protein BSKO_07621 [Bryopsis sp. KO-2023]|nr:hypothetical protein BSKO_07621 [Bryopsis sp. KO-2023]
MDAFFLTFRDANLEGRFDRYMIHGTFQVEKVFFSLCVVVIMGYIIRLSAEGIFLHQIPMVINLVNLGVIFYVRKDGVATLEKWRTLLYICSRLLGYYGFAVAHSVLNWKLEFSSNPLAVFLSMIAAHHIPGALFPAIGCRLKFRHHIPVRLMEALIFLFIQTPTTCQQFLEAPGVSDALQIEQQVDSTWQTILAGFYSQLGLNMWKTIPKKPCIHFAAYMHIVWSFGIVSYIVWRLERRSRVNFLQSLQREIDGLDVGQRRPLPEVHPTTGSVNVSHLMIMAGWSGLAWELIAVALMFCMTV